MSLDSEQLRWMWRWIDRMASGNTTIEEALSVLTNSPDAPCWVQQFAPYDDPALLHRVTGRAIARDSQDRPIHFPESTSKR